MNEDTKNTNELEPQVILVNKPAKITSHDVVYFWRKELRGLQTKRLLIGHAGTLDPFATGILIILVGKATKAQTEFMHQNKQYEATIQLGVQTDTGDLDGKVIKKEAAPKLKINAIKEVFNLLTGQQVQPVPLYAAAKVKGKKLYEYARKGEEPPFRPIRVVTIKNLEVIKYDPAKSQLTIKVDCSAGTYIRALAEKIAEQLNTVGHLIALCRTESGNFKISDCLNID